jgi:hypothetical protein
MVFEGPKVVADWKVGGTIEMDFFGGFNGTDPTPTLAQFKAYVRQGKIHYFISSGGGPGIAAGSSAASRISTWVSANYQSTTVGNVTLYNLG